MPCWQTHNPLSELILCMQQKVVHTLHQYFRTNLDMPITFQNSKFFLSFSFTSSQEGILSSNSKYSTLISSTLITCKGSQAGCYSWCTGDCLCTVLCILWPNELVCLHVKHQFSPPGMCLWRQPAVLIQYKEHTQDSPEYCEGKRGCKTCVIWSQTLDIW